jgi:FKBP-type peptidyl-prolyl cis-trans isomerase
MNTIVRIAAIALILSFACCSKPKPKVFAPQEPITRDSGLTIQILAEGTGRACVKNDKVQVEYTGTFLDGGSFDSSKKNGRPFAFWVGQRQVVAGWDEGILGMKEGEVRKLIVPAKLGYGSEEKPNIPPNSTLVFEVELVDIR